jgi:cytochrome c-type biogenesis protein
MRRITSTRSTKQLHSFARASRPVRLTAAPRAVRLAGAGILAGTAAIAVLVLATAHGPLADLLEHSVGLWLNGFAQATSGPDALAGWHLYAVAFAGGLLASLSPCILGMLPVNLSYIGATGLRSRTAAFVTATTFVAGVVVVNAVLGLFSSLFFAVFVQYRAYINIGVGIVTVVMGLWMLGAITLRLPTMKRVPTGAGPFVVGLVFALIASPCASPVLVAVLAAAAKDGSVVHSVIAMTLYALGYTAVLFLASLFAGIAMASRRILAHGELVTRVAAGILVAIGAGTVVYGLRLL